MMKNLYIFSLVLFSWCISAQSGFSTEAGETAGQLTVSLSGTANYDIPIAVPPSINEIVPQVSLSYSSGRGNGLAGYGWDISGVSVISRLPNTYYHSNSNPKEVNFNEDRYAYNGQRLLVKNNLYTNDGAEFMTETFSNIKITRHGVSPWGAAYGPSYFLVQYPDGSKATFGATSNSRSKMEWAISSWESPQGVRIHYFYNLVGDQLTISSITYGALNQAGNNSIQFIYGTRQRPESSYVGGFQFTRTTILKEIRTSVGSTGFRKYLLNHNVSSLGYERLVSVTEYSGDGSKSLNPTVFTYEDTQDQLSTSNLPIGLQLSNISTDTHASVTGDFDADGRLDMILYPTAAGQKNTYHIFNSNNTTGYTRNVGNFLEIIPGTFLTGDAAPYKVLGRQGWVVIQEDGANIKFTVFSAHPTPATSRPIITEYTRTLPSYSIDGNLGDLKFYSGDFDGNGLTEILAVRNNGLTYRIVIDKDYSAAYFHPWSQTDPVSVGDQLKVADFDGDGIPELWHFKNDSLRILDKLGTQYSTSDGDIKINKPILMGDYNGDGKTDFITPTGFGTNYAKYLSTGASTMSSRMIKTYQSYSIPYQQNGNITAYQYIANDFNYDGKTDLAIIQLWRNTISPTHANYNEGTLSIRVFHNTASGFTDVGMFVQTPFSSQITTKALPVFLSSNQPNKSLELAFISGSQIFKFQSKKDFNREKLIRKVTTGNGVSESITYSSMSGCTTTGCTSGYIPNRLVETYPNIDIEDASGHQLVTQVEKKSTYHTQRQQYTYAGGVSHIHGLGFIGFKAIKKTNWFTDESQKISNITKYSISNRGAVAEEYVVLADPVLTPTYTTTSFIGKTTHTYSSELIANKVFKIKETSLNEFNGLENTSKNSNFTHDEYNNLTSTMYTNYSGTTPEQTGSINIEYYNDPAGSKYYVGRLKKKSTSVTYNGDTVTGEEVYSYNNAHLLEQFKRKGHNTDYIVEDNVYDAFGNITVKKITAPGLAPRQTSYEYSADGRFLLKEIDIEGLVTTYNYDPNNCLLTSKTNHYGLVTQFEYDAWGRQKQVTDYLGKKKTITVTRPAFFTQNTFIATESEDGSKEARHLDDLGREFATGAFNLNGTYTWIDTEYDIYGRKIKISEPYYYPETPRYTTFKYDVYGRLIETVFPTGKIITTTYAGLSVTTNDGVQTITKTKNSVGYVVSVTDNGGTITNDYFANGKLKQSNYDGTIVSIEQDGWGRRTKLTDPSAGVYTYVYNGFGQITKETNPKGSTDYIYNAFGKITEKYENEGVTYGTATTYTYDPVTKLLVYDDWFDSQGNGNTLYYTYDDKKRVASTEEYANNALYRKSYTYDAYGRIDKETVYANNGGYQGSGSQSASKTFKYTYKNGFRWQIYDDSSNQLLWQNSTVNGKGQILTAQYGNGINVNNTFDNFGLPSQIKHDTGGSSGVNILTLNTAFDAPRGNLMSRDYSIGWLNRSETFQYDSLDRLTQFPGVSGQQESQVYDARGRITENKLGEYTYDQTKVYRNNAVNLSPEGYSYYNNKAGIFSDGAEESKGWTTYYNPQYIAYDDSKAHSGSKSIKLSNATAPEIMVFSEIYTPINNDVATEYTYSAWVYSDGPQAEMFLYMKENLSANFTFDYKQDNTTGTWKYIEKTVLVPANVKYISLRLDNNGVGNVWFDDMQIRKTSDIASQRQIGITYNMFKSPVEINESGVERVSLDYTGNNTRTAMYYGSMDEDKLQRPLRKFYSQDGSIEIKENMVTGSVEFIFYIGGDGYSAPAIFKKDNTTSGYFYLHRDFLRSIVAITNQSGSVVEKRLFDAWGNIITVQDGNNQILHGLTIVDRGYTGHEHLQTVALINMNGRIYDPVLHRFLQPDNEIQDSFNTQNFNRYAYVLNNPLKYIDPSGENWWDDNWKQVITITAVVVVTVGVTILTAGTATPFMVGVYAGAAGGFTGGALGTALNGGSVEESLVNGLIGMGKGAIFGGLGAYAASFAPAGIVYGGLYGGGSSIVLSGLGNLASGQSFFQGALWSGLLGTLGGGYGGYMKARIKPDVYTGPKVKPSIQQTLNDEIADINQEMRQAAASQATPMNFDPDGLTGGFIPAAERNLPANYYPPNNGAMSGSTTNFDLEPGMFIDRLGSDSGKFFSPAGTHLELRALPPGNTNILNKFEVIKGFRVEQSIIAPAFGKVGTGTQYFSPFLNADELMRGGYIKKLP